MVSVLGISAFYHDSAAALLIDGGIAAAAQEERFSRRKHDPRYPRAAVDYVLREGGLELHDVDHIAFYDKPFLKFERLLETYVAFAPRGLRSFSMAMPAWLREKLFQKNMLIRELKQHEGGFEYRRNIAFSEHHFSHAASAFYASPFDEALVLTLDGVGEWATTTVAVGTGRRLEIVREIHFPHSLGLLYSAFTYYLGFKVNSGEYKVMGLAPYGTPRFRKLILERLVDVKPDGSFRLDMRYFDYATGLAMTNRRFSELFGQKVRTPEEPLTQFHMDMAASIQAALEEVLLRMTRALATEFGQANLCMAGGVALNCVANAKILGDGGFRDLWVQPAAGDAGGALGAALAMWHFELGQERAAPRGDSMRGSYLGPCFTQPEIEAELTRCGAVFTVLPEEEMIAAAAAALAAGEAVGWFQGRMEYGPRALGSRSILADPRHQSMQKNLNLKVKFRESFRPFAPSVLREDLADWFELDRDSPYMLLVADVKESRRRQMSGTEEALFGIDKLDAARSDIPAVTHVDYSARVQTVHEETNPLYHRLLSAFKARTGCPVLVNTSFNVRGEPIVCTPADAFTCFMGTELDLLVCGRAVLRKSDQDPSLAASHERRYEPD